MKQTADGNQYITRMKIVDKSQVCAIALELPQDGRPITVRFYEPLMVIVRQTCGYPTTIARVYDHFWPK